MERKFKPFSTSTQFRQSHPSNLSLSVKSTPEVGNLFTHACPKWKKGTYELFKDWAAKQFGDPRSQDEEMFLLNAKRQRISHLRGMRVVGWSFPQWLNTEGYVKSRELSMLVMFFTLLYFYSAFFPLWLLNYPCCKDTWLYMLHHCNSFHFYLWLISLLIYDSSIIIRSDSYVHDSASRYINQ